ncbi:MAG: hypothetical protein CVT98_03820 [Bacteroidetes bacterium HGW-Bacteroidetes-15]|nr:MAG: hypothetical protein CVT98_03820 [Bacteroidetes bacterium HGW-Bacteroidetes-15]
MTIYYLLFAIGIYWVLRFLVRLLNSIPAQRNIHKFMLRIFPLVEFIIWIAFSIWVLNSLFSESSYYGVLISAAAGSLVLIFGWYFLRDFVSGIILKTEIPFEINQRITIPHAEGILRKTGYRSIEIETDQGGLVKIPYSQLTSNAINLQNVDESMQGNETKLRLKSTLPIQDVKDKIVKSILLLPWSSINRDPQIKVIEQNDEYNTFLVNFYSISNRHASYICQHLKNYFEADTVGLNESK